MPESKRIMLTGLPITAELKAKCGSVSDTRILSKPWNVPDIEQALNQEEPTELLSQTADDPKI
jgi:ActR/RegA family two-component response regulator